jgi:ribosomal-protein-alanine N-acetyltransferase
MSSQLYRIRAGHVTDIASVVQLERSMQEAPHWAAAEYAAIMNSDKDLQVAVRRSLLVAEAEARLLGFAVGKVLVSEALVLAELESVAVSVSARRQGVGRALCEAVISWCRELGAAEMELEVRAGSAGAIALYIELGFFPVGKRARYYEYPTEDALLMQLKLGGDK